MMIITNRQSVKQQKTCLPALKSRAKKLLMGYLMNRIYGVRAGAFRILVTGNISCINIFRIFFRSPICWMRSTLYWAATRAPILLHLHQVWELNRPFPDMALTGLTGHISPVALLRERH